KVEHDVGHALSWSVFKRAHKARALTWPRIGADHWCDPITCGFASEMGGTCALNRPNSGLQDPTSVPPVILYLWSLSGAEHDHRYKITGMEGWGYGRA